MYQKLLFIFALLFCFSQTNAQDAGNKLFRTKGYQVSYFKLPAFDITSTSGSQGSGYGLGYNLGFRYNLLDISDNSSVSLSATPGISIDYSQYFYNTPNGFSSFNFAGFGGIHLPLMVGFNTGAGSTYDTANNFGFGIELGFDVQYVPLILIDVPDDEDLDIKKFYAPFCVQLNFRYWKESTTALREFFIRYDFVKNDSKYDDNDSLEKPIIITAGFMTFINY